MSDASLLGNGLHDTRAMSHAAHFEIHWTFGDGLSACTTAMTVTVVCRRKTNRQSLRFASPPQSFQSENISGVTQE